MARLFTTGFELQSILNGVEFDTAVTTASLSISTAIKRSGGASFRTNPLTATNGYFTQTYCGTGNTNTRFMRVYLYIAALPSGANRAIILFRDNTVGNGPILRLSSTGTINLFDAQGATQIGSASSALSTATWYRLEVSYNYSTGAIAFYIDGTLIASGTMTASLDMNVVRIGMVDSDTCDLYYDDIAINDSSGSFQNTYPGAGAVFSLRGNNSGDFNTFATQTGGTAGAANNYTRINEITPNDATSFNGSSTLNEHDLVNFDPSGIGSSDTVNVVEVWPRFRNSTADATAGIKFEIEKTGSGTVLQSSELKPNSTTWRTNSVAGAVFRVPPLVTYQDPDGSAWTQATVDTLQAGYKLTTGPGTAGRRIDVSTLAVMVDYTPAAGGATQTLTGTGYANSNSFGAGALAMAIALSGTGYANVNQFGAGILAMIIALAGTGYQNTNQFGAGYLARTITLTGTGYANSNAFGAGVVTVGPVTITGTGYANSNSFGAGALAAVIALQGSGYANTNSFGSGVLAFVTTISGTGFANTNQFGAGTLARTITLIGTGATNTVAFGAGALATHVAVSGTGFANTNAFGTGSLRSIMPLTGTGYANSNAFGAGVVTQNMVVITGTGYQNTNQFGAGYLIATTLPSSNLTIISTEDFIVITQSPDDSLSFAPPEDSAVITSVEDTISVVV